MSFPVTKLYLWPNDDAMVIKRIHAKLMRASRLYTPVEDWEVLLVLKMPRIKHKLERDAISASSSLSSVTANDRLLVRDDAEKDNSSYYFFRCNRLPLLVSVFLISLIAIYASSLSLHTLFISPLPTLI